MSHNLKFPAPISSHIPSLVHIRPQIKKLEPLALLGRLGNPPNRYPPHPFSEQVAQSLGTVPAKFGLDPSIKKDVRANFVFGEDGESPELISVAFT